MQVAGRLDRSCSQVHRLSGSTKALTFIAGSDPCLVLFAVARVPGSVPSANNDIVPSTTTPATCSSASPSSLKKPKIASHTACIVIGTRFPSRSPTLTYLSATFPSPDAAAPSPYTSSTILTITPCLSGRAGGLLYWSPPPGVTMLRTLVAEAMLLISCGLVYL